MYPKHEQVEVEKFPRRGNCSSDFKLQIDVYRPHRNAIPDFNPHNSTQQSHYLLSNCTSNI